MRVQAPCATGRHVEAPEGLNRRVQRTHERRADDAGVRHGHRRAPSPACASSQPPPDRGARAATRRRAAPRRVLDPGGDGDGILVVELGQRAPAPGAEVALVELGRDRRVEPERLGGLARARRRAGPGDVGAVQARAQRAGLVERARVERLVEREGRTAGRRGRAWRMRVSRVVEAAICGDCRIEGREGAEPFDRLAAISATVRGSRCETGAVAPL
jgi:hypothetical protein